MNIDELTIGQAKKEVVLTDADEATIAATKSMHSTIVDQPDILGMTGGFDYFIHLDEKYLTTTDKYARAESTMLNRPTLVLVCVAMAVVAITAINLCI